MTVERIGLVLGQAPAQVMAEVDEALRCICSCSATGSVTDHRSLGGTTKIVVTVLFAERPDEGRGAGHT